MRNVNSASASTLGKGTTTIWNGSSWNNGVPNVNTIAQISGIYDTTINGNISCLDLILTSGSLTVNINTIVKVLRNIQQQSGFVLNIVNGELALLNKDADTTSVKLTISRDLEYTHQNFDYRIIGDPISGKTAATLSPGTLATRIYRYDTIIDLFSTTYLFDAEATGANVAGSIFKGGIGYLIRTPVGFSSTGAIWTVSSNNLTTGKLNAGVIKTPFQNDEILISDIFAGVCNPYSASIDIKKFLKSNPFISETTFYWLKSNSVTGYAYYQADAYETSANISHFPRIKPFEGFFVRIKKDSIENEIIFTPDMIIIDEPFNLFSSYHLSLSQTGFTVPIGFCAYVLYNYPVDFTLQDQILSASQYRLQLNNNVVSTNLLSSYENVSDINIRVSGAAGTLSIKLDSRVGIYNGLGFMLEDRLLGVFHNLVTGPYSFTSALENYTDRFYLNIQ